MAGDSTGFAPGESGAGNSRSAAVAAASEGALGMSTEMELSLGEATRSGRRLRRGAAGLPRRSRHYTDVEVGDGEEEDEGENDQVALRKKLK